MRHCAGSCASQLRQLLLCMLVVNIFIGQAVEVGSIFFTLGAFGSLWKPVELSIHLRRLCHLIPYLLGQFEFNAGSVLLLHSTMNSSLRLLSDEDLVESLRKNRPVSRACRVSLPLGDNESPRLFRFFALYVYLGPRSVLM